MLSSGKYEELYILSQVLANNNTLKTISLLNNDFSDTSNITVNNIFMFTFVRFFKFFSSVVKWIHSPEKKWINNLTNWAIMNIEIFSVLFFFFTKRENLILHWTASKSITPFCCHTIAAFPQQEMLINRSKHFSSHFSSIRSGWLSSLVSLVKLLYQNLLSSSPRKTQELEIMKASVIHLIRWNNWVKITEKMSLHALFSHLPFFWWWWLSCNKFCMLEMVWFLDK